MFLRNVGAALDLLGMNPLPSDSLQLHNTPSGLNDRTWAFCQHVLPASAERLRLRRIDAHPLAWDFGNQTPGGLEAGLFLAKTCMAHLADVQLVPSELPGTGLAVQVTVDRPVEACLHSQYAGWKIASDDYFAMGSGPMRIAAAREPLFEKVQAETCEYAVGILESDRVPPAALIEQIAQACGVPADRLCLLLARTASQAGTVQVVARSVETAMHKLMDLGADVSQVESGFGVAPLPPVAKNDLAGIGRTNDAILYGGQVTLWVRGEDDAWAEMLPKIPSRASDDYGKPFAELFAQYDYDFYKIDPHLFSPAVIRLVNLDTGRVMSSGCLNAEILSTSCAS